MNTPRTPQKTHFSKRLSRTLVAAVSALLSISLLPSTASATTLTWNGTSGSTWNSAGNWSPAQVPVNGDDLIFNTASTTAKNDFANNALTINTITFNATTQTLSQNSTNGINLSNGVTAAAGTLVSAMVLPVTLTANQTWSVGTGSTLTVNRGFAMGNYTLTKTGTGTLKLTNNQGSASAGSKIAVQNGTLEALYQNDVKAATAIEMGGGVDTTFLKISDPGGATRLTDLQSAISINSATTGAVTINNAVLSSVTNITLSGGINLGTATNADLVFNTTNGSVTKVTGIISGSMSSANSRGNIQLSGGNGEVQILNASNSFTGVRTLGILQGTLVLGVNDAATGSSNGALGNNTVAVFVGTSSTVSGATPSFLLDGAISTGRSITVGNSGNTNNVTYTLGGRTADASSFSGGITLARNVQLTAATGGTVTFSGLLNDSTNTQSVTKVGNGTVNLSRASGNTYDGGTTVSVGTLLVNNTSGSGTGTGTVSVSSGATLGGNSIISGATTINGTHSPGNSPGLQTFGSSLTYNAGATVVWELAGNSTGGRGSTFDGINVGTGLTFSGATALTLTFNGIGSTVNWSSSLWNADKLNTNGWLIYSGATSLTGFGNLTITTANWADAGGALFNTARPGATFSTYQSGNDIYLNYAIPEPTTWALLAVSLTTVMVLRRRRQS